ncbi:alpha-amylase family glycosyl hydrolase [Lysinibacillus sp. KU-BSD001]|uniref:alpha-amylase family glycosyl hydrolase n=1 Tax=Lysinibacillus sp. KU-BSD001 TaxID=3141328 RepID=UPI0036EA94F0
MKCKKWISTAAASMLLATSLFATPMQAEETRTIADESIYDVLVDRYFNGSGKNDEQVNTQDPTQFAGGDFIGLVSRGDQIIKLDYTIVSIGSIFATEKYDGSMPISYTALEPHFGTAEELTTAVDYFNDNNIKVMVDFPLSNVSANHEWTNNTDWVTSTANGQAQFDLANPDVQAALKAALVEFVSAYDFGGVRLTNIDGASEAFLNELIAAVKAVNDTIYVIANGESTANFDADFHEDTHSLFKEAYKDVDLIAEHVTKYATSGDKPSQLFIDSIWTNRFTYDVMEGGNKYPPNRLPLALTATLLMPGVAVTQYGTEIGMNGEVGPESHQYYNFKTDEELVDVIANLQSLRNQSWTLRNGEFNILKNEDGFLAFERKSDEEHWIIVINNTSVTNRVNLSADVIGEDKELRGMFESDIIRVNKNGDYPIILDREMFEMYQVIDKTGINISYMIALAGVWILFTAFIIIIVKRGRKRQES